MPDAAPERFLVRGIPEFPDTIRESLPYGTFFGRPQGFGGLTVRLYPLDLKIEGRRCVVIGGGGVAERKVESLRECGAVVTVVSPEFTETLEKWASEGRIETVRRPFTTDDVKGATLVIAATNVRSVNEMVFAAGRAEGVLVNVVDVPDLCDFYVPATVTRGDLQIAVSTSGTCPAMAKAIRKRLEELFGPEYGGYVDLGGWLRTELMAKAADAKRRQAALERLLDSDALECLARGDEAGARRIADDCLQEALDGKADS